MVSQAFPPEQGGNASRMGDLTRYLPDEDRDITVLAPHPTYPHGQFERTWSRQSVETRYGNTVYRLWTWQTTSEDPGFLSRAAYYLLFSIHALMWIYGRDEEFDVIITSTPPVFTAIPGIFANQFREMQWIVDVRDFWIDAAVALDIIDSGAFTTHLTRRFQQYVFSRADRLFATTSHMREMLVDRYPVEEDNVVLVPNGVDLSRFDHPRTNHENKVVYAGNLGHAQELAPFIRAMAEVDTDLTFEIVGDGDIRPELERVAIEAGVDDVVEFIGLVPRDAVPDHLVGSVAGFAPIKPTERLKYAIPTKAYEYMACHIPVIATGTGALESFLERSGGGIVVDTDPSTIARVLDELVENAEKRVALADSGHQYVTENCSRKRVAERVGDEIDKLCAEKRRS